MVAEEPDTRQFYFELARLSAMGPRFCFLDEKVRIVSGDSS